LVPAKLRLNAPMTRPITRPIAESLLVTAAEHARVPRALAYADGGRCLPVRGMRRRAAQAAGDGREVPSSPGFLVCLCDILACLSPVSRIRFSRMSLATLARLSHVSRTSRNRAQAARNSSEELNAEELIFVDANTVLFSGITVRFSDHFRESQGLFRAFSGHVRAFWPVGVHSGADLR